MTENEFKNTADAHRPEDSLSGKARATATQARDAASDAAQRARESATQSSERARESASNARDYTAERYQQARDYSRERYDDAKAYSQQRWHDAQDASRQARERAAEGIDSNPLAAAGLGLLAGMAIGLLLPRTRQENRLVGAYRDDLVDQASTAAKAARDAGEQEFRAIAGEAKTQARDLSEKAIDAAKRSADAGAREANIKS